MAETIKDIRQQLVDMTSLEQQLLSSLWAGDAADKCIKEFSALNEESAMVLASLIQKPHQLLKMADIYDRVEEFNVSEEAGKLPSDFIV